MAFEPFQRDETPSREVLEPLSQYADPAQSALTMTVAADTSSALSSIAMKAA